jgi:hypothetical protein
MPYARGLLRRNHPFGYFPRLLIKYAKLLSLYNKITGAVAPVIFFLFKLISIEQEPELLVECTCSHHRPGPQSSR